MWCKQHPAWKRETGGLPAEHCTWGAGVGTGKSALLLGLSDLYRKSHLSDVTLVVGPHGGPCKAIPAHRQILSQHSRVWDAMWKCNMLEVWQQDIRTLITLNRPTVHMCYLILMICNTPKVLNSQRTCLPNSSPHSTL